MIPNASWVSKWQHIPKTASPGAYAISVTGTLPDAVLDMLERKGITTKY